MTHRLHVVIEGRVQGVGFRYSTRRQAEALGLKGWVRNRVDGAVEAEFEGDRASLEKMEAWCEKGSAFSHVVSVESEWEEGPPKYEGFGVRY